MDNHDIQNGPHQPHYSVILPIYNEESCLEEVLARIETALGSSGQSYEVLCIDDASTDLTWSIIGRSPIKGTLLLKGSGFSILGTSWLFTRASKFQRQVCGHIGCGCETLRNSSLNYLKNAKKAMMWFMRYGKNVKKIFLNVQDIFCFIDCFMPLCLSTSRSIPAIFPSFPAMWLIL